MATKALVNCEVHDIQRVGMKHVTPIEIVYPDGNVLRQFRTKCPIDNEIIIEVVADPDPQDLFKDILRYGADVQIITMPEQSATTF